MCVIMTERESTQAYSIRTSLVEVEVDMSSNSCSCVQDIHAALVRSAA